MWSQWKWLCSFFYHSHFLFPDPFCLFYLSSLKALFIWDFSKQDYNSMLFWKLSLTKCNSDISLPMMMNFKTDITFLITEDSVVEFKRCQNTNLIFWNLTMCYCWSSSIISLWTFWKINFLIDLLHLLCNKISYSENGKDNIIKVTYTVCGPSKSGKGYNNTSSD